MARRIAFVRRAADELGLDVECVCDRAEILGRASNWRSSIDVVVARSLAAPAVTAEYAAPFLRAGGFALVAEPPGGESERWSSEGLGQLGMRAGTLTVAPAATLQRLDQVVLCADRFPRRVGIASKRPLF